MSKAEKILVIGANGQIGSVLCNALRNAYGPTNVIASDLQMPGKTIIGTFEKLDVLDGKRLQALVKKYQITQIYHLAAILSAKGEQNPRQTWDINMNALWNVLEIARQEKLHKVYFPSSIAVFGPETPRENAPQRTVMQPTTIYGMTKQAGESLCAYYHQHYGVDVRGLRYPGLIGYESLPGGGTTDYAVDIFHKALSANKYECFLRADTALPMMYMPDAIRATLELMEAPADSLKTRYAYNLRAPSFTPAQLADEIRKHLPDFQISYQPDFRQAIADSWVASLDDSEARRDWGWQPRYDLAAMTADMIKNLRARSEKREYDETRYL